MKDEELYERLCEFITPERKKLFDSIARNRTRHITIVLENIYQSQNASAVLRTCDLTGIQNVHVVEDRNKYTLDKNVSLGSSKWLTLDRYNESHRSINACTSELKSKGYRLVATSPRTEKSSSLDHINIDRPIAIMFGTELDGLTDKAFALADERMHVPMFGFTESYNISVCAALVLYTLTQRLRERGMYKAIAEQEQIALKISWAKKMLRKADLIEQNIKADPK